MPSATATSPTHHKEAELIYKKQPITPCWVGRVPQLKPGHYADGMPLHEVQYLSCKLILHPNKFTSRKSLFDFANVMKQPCKEHDVGFSLAGYDSKPEKIREVLFIDTEDFRLYNNAFIVELDRLLDQRVGSQANPIQARLPGRRTRDRLQVPPP
jgi:hypothetical protein